MMKWLKLNNLQVYLFFSLIVIANTFTSCSNIKHLPKNEKLYVGAKVEIKGNELDNVSKKELAEDLEKLPRPKPNSKILGLRVKLFIYNFVGTPSKPKGIKHWLKTKIGEPPVLFSKVNLDYNAKILTNYLNNRGYFNAEAIADSSEKNRHVTAEYAVTPKFQYKIREVNFIDDSTRITEDIIDNSENTLLVKNEPYDLETIKAERVRIDARLKETGYYYFGPDYLVMQVDSTVGKHQVDIDVKLKSETPAEAREKYTINNVFIYPNYALNKDTILNRYSAGIKYHDYRIFDYQDTYKPFVYTRSLSFHKGYIYNRTDHNLSLSRLVNLGNFKFVKNKFSVSDSFDNALDASYYLTPLPRKSIRFELLGKTNSANYSGSELKLNWTNRNTFRGAEQLTVSAFGGIETQISGLNSGFSVYRIGAEGNLVWPRLIFPHKFYTEGQFVPKTRLSLGYEFQNRTNLYSLNSFKTSFGYLWKVNVRKEHELKLTEINYVNSFNVTDLYNAQIAINPTLQRVIDQQLIFGPSYSYTFTNTTDNQRINTMYYKGNIDLSGNIIGLLTGANAKNGDIKRIFDVPFNQYIKLENEFRFYHKLNKESQIASRIIVGTGIPYGNSIEMPFIKQFFIGGVNSIRAFRARAIGPGSYQPIVAENAFLPDQSGDLKIELNAEYRSTLAGPVKGALFIDAGNIWLLNNNPLKPGAQFSKNFISELAAGVGAGLRIDLSFLILRTDLAFPIRKPYLPKSDRWVIDDINIASRDWRRENLVFNLAIGYPF